MRFVKLSLSDSTKEVYVNMDIVTEIYPRGDCSTLYFSAAYEDTQVSVEVKETPEAILKMAVSSSNSWGL